MDKEAWQAIVHGVTKSQTRLSTHTHTYSHTHVLTHTHISIISSMNCAFSVKSKEWSSYPMLSKFSPILSSKHFIVLHFSFRYLLIWFNFVKVVRSVSRFSFFLLHLSIQFFQHHLLRKLSLLYCVPFVSLPKISWKCLWSSSWAVSSVPLI